MRRSSLRETYYRRLAEAVVPWYTFRKRVVELGWSEEEALKTPPNEHQKHSLCSRIDKENCKVTRETVRARLADEKFLPGEDEQTRFEQAQKELAYKWSKLPKVIHGWEILEVIRGSAVAGYSIQVIVICTYCNNFKQQVILKKLKDDKLLPCRCQQYHAGLT